MSAAVARRMTAAVRRRLRSRLPGSAAPTRACFQSSLPGCASCRAPPPPGPQSHTLDGLLPAGRVAIYRAVTGDEGGRALERARRMPQCCTERAQDGCPVSSSVALRLAAHARSAGLPRLRVVWCGGRVVWQMSGSSPQNRGFFSAGFAGS